MLPPRISFRHWFPRALFFRDLRYYGTCNRALPLCWRMVHSDHGWLLSYDDCPAIRDLYSFAHIGVGDVIYSVPKSSRKRERLISPRHRNRSTLAVAA